MLAHCTRNTVSESVGSRERELMDRTNNDQTEYYSQKNIDTDRAREILGAKAKRLKDKDIWEIINSLYFLSSQVINQVVKE